jgi:hypothetical protein
MPQMQGLRIRRLGLDGWQWLKTQTGVSSEFADRWSR